MECFIVIKEDIDLERGELRLRGDEAHHAVKSLRLRVGEGLLATDLEGTCYRCVIRDVEGMGGKDAVHPASLSARVEEVLPEYCEPKRDILLVQGMIAQPARWEFLLEKATELGVRAIQPISTERTERENVNRERSERILRAAVKQTKRARMPELRELSSFERALDSASREGRAAILLHEAPDVSESLSAMSWELKKPESKPLAIFIGPEGGFSEREVLFAKAAGAKVCTLGPRRLRAETAALASLAILMDETKSEWLKIF
ncbi:MAG TPA: RsmE family RNA methyltransferase [Candidatus Kapabacteria bacterium]